MSVEVYPVRNKKDLKKFLMLPFSIYRDDPYWVPPLVIEERKRFDPKKNPFYEHAQVELFVAEKNGEPVGRITAHIDENYNTFHGEKTGFFGFFESINDQSVANSLFDTASQWLKERGMNKILGPMSFNTNDVCGLLIDDFSSPPVVMMSYNPKYYVQLLENYGFVKAKDLLAYIIEVTNEWLKFARRLEERLSRLAKRAQENGFTIRDVNLKDLDNEVKKLREIYNEAWEKNWGFVPMTEKEFYKLAKELKTIVEPTLVKIVEYKGEPAAFGLMIPDVNEVLIKMKGKLFPFGIFHFIFGMKKIKRLRLLALGIKKSFRKKGADSLLYYSMLKSGLELKRYDSCEVSWLLEDNYLIIRAVEFMGGKPYKTYRLYEKSL
jgi:hypothetical protein